jgi:survival of motor neuron-related-splicing factor 30
MSSLEEHIQEYESQLADVDALLHASPGDPSLLALKSDLLELLSITRQSALCSTAASDEPNAPSSVFDLALEAAVETSVGREVASASEAPAAASFADTVQEAAAEAASIPTTIDTAKEAPKKKSKSVKAEFEVPQHLIPLDTDSAAERSKKQRALKALKSKWRESKKEVESAMKQKSWQSFQKKKKLKSSSMFKTGEAAVGVVSAAGRQLTDFGERKRHKHE